VKIKPNDLWWVIQRIGVTGTAAIGQANERLIAKKAQFIVKYDKLGLFSLYQTYVMGFKSQPLKQPSGKPAD